MEIIHNVVSEHGNLIFLFPFKNSELGCCQETAHLNSTIERNLIKEPFVKEWVGFTRDAAVPKGKQGGNKNEKLRGKIGGRDRLGVWD